MNKELVWDIKEGTYAPYFEAKGFNRTYQLSEVSDGEVMLQRFILTTLINDIGSTDEDLYTFEEASGLAQLDHESICNEIEKATKEAKLRLIQINDKFEKERALADRLADKLKKLESDCLASDFNEHWESYTEVAEVLTAHAEARKAS